MALSTTTKGTAQANVFVGISSLYLKKDGFTSTKSTTTPATYSLTVGKSDLVEVPCSKESGFTFDGGSPTTNNFMIHGMSAAYTSTFTPGDGSLTIEIPTNQTEILDLVYGVTGSALTVTLPTGETIGGQNKLSGKAYPFSQKSVNFGIIAVSDDESKVLFFKKVKATATPSFDGTEKPYAITLTATISGGADEDAVAVLEPTA